MKIVIALIIFSLIILFHEFGHFLLAKMNKVTVVEFSLGMGPRLLSVQKGETRYSLKLLPFGGSCMMLGEDEATQEPGIFRQQIRVGQDLRHCGRTCFQFYSGISDVHDYRGQCGI